MRRFVLRSFFLTILFAASVVSFAQSDYKVVTIINGGTISGTVKWSGPVPHALTFPITKDPHICDPESTKTTDLPVCKICAVAPATKTTNSIGRIIAPLTLIQY